MKILILVKGNKLLFAVVLLYMGMFAVSPDKAFISVNNSVYYLIEMFQVLPVIFLFTVVLEALVPKKIIMESFGEDSGWKGKIYSLVLGSISAGPIYAAFPVCKTLLGKGASITNIVIVLSSWAVIKIPMLANEVKFLGIEFMAARWVLTVGAILIMAQIMSKAVKRKDLPADKNFQETGVFKIKEDYCLGCGVCVKMLPEYYEIFDDKARVMIEEINQNDLERVLKSVEDCPTMAIEYEPEIGYETG
ncbi:permease [Alkalibacter saccharofermentans]|uniref:Ferredoxin n=1 Tax=Alkalibacter saccharofermentans DSM 14828 TaxID=1120975 RepID=A0A1M4X490_9FIRM|nr:permease [Alkalibacter saccharofermentans]SHE88294.1 Ferredoxin [Alkalibacter saccharofermentans DSM 14828]